MKVTYSDRIIFMTIFLEEETCEVKFSVISFRSRLGFRPKSWYPISK